MPISYRGSGNLQEINLLLYGDGATASIDINLSEAPFALDFKGQIPSRVYIVGEQSASPSSYPDLTGIDIGVGTPPTIAILKLRFKSPLPEVTYGQSDEVGGPSSAINFIIRFIYG